MSRWTLLAPSEAAKPCRPASSPSDESIRLGLSSTFFGEVSSLSARTTDEGFTSFPFVMPYTMPPVKRATGLLKRGEILPGNALGRPGGFVAILWHRAWRRLACLRKDFVL